LSKKQYISVTNRDKTKLPTDDIKITIQQFLLDEKDYDVNPPYQRGFVWPVEYRINLLEAIVAGSPINAMHIVRKGAVGTTAYKENWVLDGKQRLSTIVSFAKNQFPIWFDVDGKLERVYYKDIKKRAKAGSGCCVTFLEDFHKYTLTMAQYESMPFTTQREIFKRVNYSRNLETSEKYFCADFVLAKNTFEYVLNKVFKPRLGKFLRGKNKKLLDSEKKDGIRFIYNLFFIGFDRYLDSTYKARSLIDQEQKDSLRILEERLSTYGWDYADPLKEEDIKLALGDSYLTFKKACDIVGKILSYKAGLSSLLSSYTTLFDLIIFVIRKLQDKVITSNMVQENIDKFHKSFILYICYKEGAPTAEELRRSNNFAKTITAKQDILDELIECPADFYALTLDELSNETKTNNERLAKLNKVKEWDFKLDLGDKDRSITNKERAAAILNSDGTDPVTGDDLEIGDIDFHHINPNSLSSTSALLPVSKGTNRKFGGNSKEFVERQKEFNDKYSCRPPRLCKVPASVD